MPRNPFHGTAVLSYCGKSVWSGTWLLPWPQLSPPLPLLSKSCHVEPVSVPLTCQMLSGFARPLPLLCPLPRMPSSHIGPGSFLLILQLSVQMSSPTARTPRPSSHAGPGASSKTPLGFPPSQSCWFLWVVTIWWYLCLSHWLVSPLRTDSDPSWSLLHPQCPEDGLNTVHALWTFVEWKNLVESWPGSSSPDTVSLPMLTYVSFVDV